MAKAAVAPKLPPVDPRFTDYVPEARRLHSAAVMADWGLRGLFRESPLNRIVENEGWESLDAARAAYFKELDAADLLSWPPLSSPEKLGRFCASAAPSLTRIGIWHKSHSSLAAALAAGPRFCPSELAHTVWGAITVLPGNGKPAFPEDPTSLAQVTSAFYAAAAWGNSTGRDPLGAGKPSKNARAVRGRRSSTNCDTTAKLVAGLIYHHQYSAGSCLNYSPIGCNELGRVADTGQASASEFFKKQFHSHAAYKRCCSDQKQLIAALKILNGELSPFLLYGSDPDKPPTCDEA